MLWEPARFDIQEPFRIYIYIHTYTMIMFGSTGRFLHTHTLQIVSEGRLDAAPVWQTKEGKGDSETFSEMQL